VSESSSKQRGGVIAAIVVTYESSARIGRCLEALRAGAPLGGLDVRVVDNASRDASAELAESLLGPGHVIRLPENRGYAAGVNAGLAAVDAAWVVVLNPDVEVPPRGIDRLVEVLERHPRAGLAGPRVVGPGGRRERSVGRFPTFALEWGTSWFLDRLGWPGRYPPQPRATVPVDWVSGCAWVLRAAAVESVGPLDEDYFMYCEDVDYCRRLHDAGWDVLAVPEVEWFHGLGQGSTASGLGPADGGPVLLRYFAKFHPEVPQARLRRVLRRSWTLRRAWRRARLRLGDSASAALVRRYDLALERLDRV
jgi:hypothetical protein